jgi:hypothetical protein
MAEDHTYLVREPFEELLWWIQLPALMRLAGATAPPQADAKTMAAQIDSALAALEKAGYRLDAILEPELAAAPQPSHSVEPEALHSVPKTGKIDEPSPEKLRPQEPVAAKPVGPVNPEGPPEDY